jgi:hypothetical protein
MHIPTIITRRSSRRFACSGPLFPATRRWRTSLSSHYQNGLRTGQGRRNTSELNTSGSNWIEGQAKPDFQMYFDCADTTSPLNYIATTIYNLLPSYEQRKVLRPSGKTIRGPCVLCFSPMKSTTFSSHLNSTTTVSAPADKKWSLHDFTRVLSTFIHCRKLSSSTKVTTIRCIVCLVASNRKAKQQMQVLRRVSQ